MATKRDRRRAQRNALWKDMRTGSFTCSQVLKATIAGTNPEQWVRSNIDRVQPSTASTLKVVLDTQHARALDHGLAAASQFGYQVLDIDVTVVPSTDAINAEDSRLAFGELGCHWVQPSPLRFEALQQLKDLERKEDEADAFDGIGNEASPDVNPLLALPLATAESSAIASGSAEEAKGTRIIRYGWGDGHPNVLYQSGFSIDLNNDDDTGDTGESQSYVLVDGSTTEFGILERMESFVNPTMGGLNTIEREWANPLSTTMVVGPSYARDSWVWACNPKLENTAGTNLAGGLHTKVARFRNIHALGGLVAFTMPEMNTAGVGLAGTANNDYDLVFTIKVKRWVAMV